MKTLISDTARARTRWSRRSCLPGVGEWRRSAGTSGRTPGRRLHPTYARAPRRTPHGGQIIYPICAKIGKPQVSPLLARRAPVPEPGRRLVRNGHGAPRGGTRGATPEANAGRERQARLWSPRETVASSSGSEFPSSRRSDFLDLGENRSKYLRTAELAVGDGSTTSSLCRHYVSLARTSVHDHVRPPIILTAE